MEDLRKIVLGTTAKLTHVCHGIVCYEIRTATSLYQLKVDLTTDEWKTTYLMPEMKAICLMGWIRKGMEDGRFIKLSEGGYE